MATRLPEKLFGTYQQYKQEEKAVIDWVVRTATAHGYSTDKPIWSSNNNNASPVPLSNQPVVALATGLAALSTGSPKTKSKNSAQITDASIPIYDIIEPLEVIVKSRTLKQLPIEIAESLRSIIAARARCSAFFRRNTEENDAEGQSSNKRHLYPLKVLRDAVRVLKPIWPSAVPSTVKPYEEAEQTDKQSWNNVFAALDETDSSERSIETTTSTSLNTVKPVPRRTKEELEEYRRLQAEDQIRLARYHLLEEIEKVEAFLFQEWISYAIGAQSFATATLLTNQAIDMICCVEQETCIEGIDGSIQSQWLEGFFRSLPRDDAGLVTEPLLRSHEVVYTVLASNGSKELNEPFTTAFVSKFGYFTAPTDVQYTVELNHMRCVLAAESQQGFQFKHQSVIDMEGTCVQEGFSWRPRELLTQAWKQKEALRSAAGVSASLAFAVRLDLLVNLTTILHQETERSVMLLTLHRSMDMVSEHCKFITPLNARHRNIKDKDYNVIAPMNCEISKQIAIAAQSWPPAASSDPSKNGDMHLPSETYPYANMLLAEAALASYDVYYRTAIVTSRALLNANLLTVLAHIYNICQQEGGLPTNQQWQDLEYLCKVLGDASVFRGGPRPTKAEREQYYPRYVYADGYSSAKLGRTPKDNSRALQHMNAAAVPMLRDLRVTGWPLSTVLLKSLSSPAASASCFVRRSELLLRGTLVEKLLGNYPKNVGMRDDSSLEHQAKLAKLADTGPKITTVQLLALQRRQLTTEQELLDFDWFELHKACLDLALSLSRLWRDKTLGLEDVAIQRCDLETNARNQLNDVISDLLIGMKKQEHSKSTQVHDQSKARIAALSKAFKDFIATRGEVGLKGWKKLPEIKLQRIKTLDPDVLQNLKDVSAKYGLYDEFFTGRQRKGVDGLKHIISLDEETRSLFTKKQEPTDGKCSLQDKKR